MNKTNIFILKSRTKWKDKYDYDYTKYIKSKEKVIITCKLHGNFEQQPSNHLSGKEGCKQCASKASKDRQRMPINEFIQKVESVHGKIFDFSEFTYRGTEYKSEFLCIKHNKKFTQLCSSTLSGKLGCPVCKLELRKSLLADDKESFIIKARAVHKDAYSYDKFTYLRSGTLSTITCPIHGDFEQSANSHLMGRGCPSCANYGFDDSKPAILYYLSINNGEAYKIGITNRSVEERYTAEELSNIKCLFIKNFIIGKYARLEEKKILTKFKKFKSDKHLLKSGNTELFTIDILEMENTCQTSHGVKNS